MRHPLFFAIAVALGVIADQAAKWWVFSSIALKSSVPVVNGVLHFTPVYNDGVAFSMLAGNTLLILLISLVAVTGITWWYWAARNDRHAIFLYALALLLSGAVGNLIDRAFPPQQVRDFLEFVPPLPLVGHWAIFNIADSFICIGVGLFIVAEIFFPAVEEEEEKKAEAKESSAATAESKTPAPTPKT